MIKRGVFKVKKDLPSVFSNPILKEIKNNTEYFYGSLDNKEDVRGQNILDKINHIFASKDFVYKKEVKVTTADNIYNVTLVGRNTSSLLTLDNQSIPISSVTDIEVIN